MRCPECSSQTTKCARWPRRGGGEPRGDDRADRALLDRVPRRGQPRRDRRGNGAIFRDGALFGPAVAAGDWWRLVTYGFLHAGLLHIGFNMLLLWLFGRELEPQLGTPIFLGIYFSSLLAGAFGALLFSPRRADRRRLRRDLRPDGRGGRDPLRARHQPVPDGHRRC